MKLPNDQDLLDAVAAGDETAFATLYERHRDWVYRLAFRFTRDEALAADVTQDVFMHLLGRAGKLQLHAKLTTYLYPVTRHAVLATLRKKRPALAGDDVLDGACAEPANESLGELAEAVADVPGPQREILLMRVVHDMSLADIAEALQIPLGTVKSRLHAALTTLREHPRARPWMED